jgi:hypothetical protein
LNQSEYYLITNYKGNTKIEGLYDIAEKGDSVYKAAFSSDLLLIKQNGSHYYFSVHR